MAISKNGLTIFALVVTLVILGTQNIFEFSCLVSPEGETEEDCLPHTRQRRNGQYNDLESLNMMNQQFAQQAPTEYEVEVELNVTDVGAVDYLRRLLNNRTFSLAVGPTVNVTHIDINTVCYPNGTNFQCICEDQYVWSHTNCITYGACDAITNSTCRCINSIPTNGEYCQLKTEVVQVYEYMLEVEVGVSNIALVGPFTDALKNISFPVRVSNSVNITQIDILFTVPPIIYEYQIFVEVETTDADQLRNTLKNITFPAQINTQVNISTADITTVCSQDGAGFQCRCEDDYLWPCDKCATYGKCDSDTNNTCSCIRAIPTDGQYCQSIQHQNLTGCSLETDVYEYIISVELNISDVSLIDRLRTIVSNISSPISINNHIQISEVNISTVCSPSSGGFQCRCEDQYIWSCDQCLTYGSCDNSTYDTCGCINALPPDGQYCQPVDQYNFTACLPSTPSPPTTPPVVYEYIISVELNISDVSLIDQLRTIVNNISSPISINNHIQISEVNISTVCSPSSGGFQCRCEDQYIWSCDQCLTYGSCDNSTYDTCGCINALPPDGQYCQPVDQYNFTACLPSTPSPPTTPPVVYEYIISVELNISDVSLIDQLRTIVNNISSPISINNHIQISEVNISTVCSPSSGGFQCRCEDQYIWSCDQCLTYGSCDNSTYDTCGCINALPPDGQYCQPVDQYNFTACLPSTPSPPTTPPVVYEYIISVELNISDVSLIDQLRTIVNNISSPISINKHIQISEVNISTVCSPSSGGFQCRCEDQYIWSCDQCLTYGSCDNSTYDTCGCINALPPDGQYCQPVDQYNFTACLPSTPSPPTTPPVVYEYIISVELNISDVSLIDQLRTIVNNISSPISINNHIQISEVNISTVCYPNGTTHQCRCEEQFLWPCHMCSTYGKCYEGFDNSCRCINTIPPDGSYCQPWTELFICPSPSPPDVTTTTVATTPNTTTTFTPNPIAVTDSTSVTTTDTNTTTAATPTTTVTNSTHFTTTDMNTTTTATPTTTVTNSTTIATTGVNTTLTMTSAITAANTTTNATTGVNTTTFTTTPTTTLTNSTTVATTNTNTTTAATPTTTVTNSTTGVNTTTFTTTPTPTTTTVTNSTTVATTSMNTTTVATTGVNTTTAATTGVNTTIFTTTGVNTTTAATTSMNTTTVATTGVNTTTVATTGVNTTTPATTGVNTTTVATTGVNTTTPATTGVNTTTAVTTGVSTTTAATTGVNTTTPTTTGVNTTTPATTDVNTTTAATTGVNTTTAATTGVSTTTAATTGVNTTTAATTGVSTTTAATTGVNTTTAATTGVNTTTGATTGVSTTTAATTGVNTTTGATTGVSTTTAATTGVNTTTAATTGVNTTTAATTGVSTTTGATTGVNTTTVDTTGVSTTTVATTPVTTTDVTSGNTTISSTTSDAPTTPTPTTSAATTTTITSPTTTTTMGTTTITTPTTTTTATTTATSPTTTTTTTTSTATTSALSTTTATPTSPTQLRGIDLEMSIRLDMEYTSELNDPTSAEYRALESRILPVLEDLYKEISGYIGVSVTRFSEGSVITDFVVETTQVVPGEITNAIKNLPDAMLAIAPVIGPVSAFYRSPTSISIPNLTYTGNTMTLTCGPPKKMNVGKIDSSAWKFKGREITDDGRMEITTSDNISKLKVNNVILADRGYYSCTLRIMALGFFQEGDVTEANIKQAPIVRLQSEVNVRCENEAMQPLTCCVQRPFTVEWFLDGNRLESVPIDDGEANCIRHDYNLGSCSGSPQKTLLFICRVVNPRSYEMTMTMTIFQDDVRCDDAQYGVGRAGDRSSIECAQGQEGSKTAICQETGEWKLQEDTCIVTEIKELLIDSQDLAKEEVPQFVANLNKTVQQQQTKIANSSATISAVVDILNTVATVSTTVNETVMHDVISTIDAIVGEDARESWATLNANETRNSSSALLGSLETISDQLVGEFSIATTRILLNRTTFDNSFRADLNSSIVIDIPNTNMNKVSITTITLSTLNNVMPLRNSTFDASLFNATSNETVSDNAINAAVVLVKINATIRNVSLSYDKLNNSLTLNPQCVFWNFTLFDNLGAWDDEGCEFVSDKNNTVTCRCNHLTSFSILMATNIPPSLRVALDIITYVGVGISLASLVICLIIEGCVWKAITRNSTAFMRHVSIVNTALSLLIADICFLIGASIAKNPLENPGEDHAVPLAPCSTATFFMHFFYLSLFFWMLVSGLLLFYRTVMVFSHMSKATMLAIGFCLGYGCPLIIAVITVAVTAPGNGYIRKFDACWLNWNETKALLAMVVPALTIVFINILIVVVVLFKMLRRGTGTTAHPDEKHTLVVITRCVIILTPLFGLTWSLGVGTMVSPTNKGIHIAFAFFNSLQGFFILVFGTLFDSKIRSILSRRVPTTSTGTGSNSTGSTSGGNSSFSGTNFISRLLGRRYIYHVSQAASSNSGGASESFVNI